MNIKNKSKQQLYCDRCDKGLTGRFNVVWGDELPPLALCIPCDKDHLRHIYSWCPEGDESVQEILVRCLGMMDSVVYPVAKSSPVMNEGWINLLRRFLFPGFEELRRAGLIERFRDESDCGGTNLYDPHFIKIFLKDNLGD